MYCFNIKIADFIFSINTSYSDCKELCKEYITDEEAEYEICITKEDIEYEQLKSDDEAKIEGYKPEVFTEGYLETISVYRKIADYISEHDANVFHGALIEKEGKGYLFTAQSGTGKTTHINNWLKCFNDCHIINGDKPILRIIDNNLIGYGTPWSGKENLNTNSSVELKAIIILTRDKTNHIEEVEPKKVIGQLISSCYKTNNIKALKFVSELTDKAKFYILGCNMDQESAIVAYEGMNK